VIDLRACVVRVLVILLLVVGLQACKRHEPPSAAQVLAKKLELPANAHRRETEHYTLWSSATDAQTRDVGTATEALRDAYVRLFPPARTQPGKMILVLYRDRAEFEQHNRSSPWAEAYYLPPASHAYAATNEANPYHWMLHEATHQLMHEVSGFRPPRWVGEGFASYLGASKLTAKGLEAGNPDPNAYPVWRLRRHPMSGNRLQDIASGQFVPLRVLLTGKGGPDVDRHFNSYYLCAWSLTQFLLHENEQRHAAGYLRFVAQGGGEREFERLVGPIDAIEAAWYRDFLQRVNVLDTIVVGPVE
jgi:hypothetical protein